MDRNDPKFRLGVEVAAFAAIRSWKEEEKVMSSDEPIPEETPPPEEAPPEPLVGDPPHIPEEVVNPPYEPPPGPETVLPPVPPET
jgi:hypothetical protein